MPGWHARMPARHDFFSQNVGKTQTGKVTKFGFTIFTG
jgi:hypothetical protein